MNRRTIDSYALFWVAGLGFLWWPFVLVKTILERRPSGRRPVALIVTTACLIVSFFIAVIRGAEPSRLIAACGNLTIWLTLCFILARRWNRQDTTEVIRGVVDLAVLQGVLAVLGRLIYPRLSGTRLPAAHFLPEALIREEIIQSSTTVLLAAPGYYGRFVTRTAGILGVSTWAGALAAVGVLLLLFASKHLGPYFQRPSVRYASIAICLSTLYWTYSRVDVIALVVGSATILAMKTRRTMHPTLWLASACLVVAATLAVLPALPIQKWFAEANAPREGSLESRSDIYVSTLGEVEDSPIPLVGNGIKERSEELVASRGTHSTYLGLSYRGGLLCTLSFVVFLVGVAYRGINRNADVAVGLMAFTLVWCFTDDIDVGNFMPLGILIAYALAVGQYESEPSDDRPPADTSSDPPPGSAIARA